MPAFLADYMFPAHGMTHFSFSSDWLVVFFVTDVIALPL